jgi:hypothetical protein
MRKTQRTLRTPLGRTIPDLSDLVLIAAQVPDEGVDAFPHLPGASASVRDTVAPPLVMILRCLYGMVRDAKMVESHPIVFAIGPLPVAADSADVEIRVDICTIPADADAHAYAARLAAAYPAVLAVAFERVVGTGALVRGGVPDAPGVVSGVVAVGHMAGDEDVPEGMHESWILLDGAEHFDPCLPVVLTHTTPAEA